MWNAIGTLAETLIDWKCKFNLTNDEIDYIHSKNLLIDIINWSYIDSRIYNDDFIQDYFDKHLKEYRREIRLGKLMDRDN